MFRIFDVSADFGCVSPRDLENRVRGDLLYILVVGELRGIISQLFMTCFGTIGNWVNEQKKHAEAAPSRLYLLLSETVAVLALKIIAELRYIMSSKCAHREQESTYERRAFTSQFFSKPPCHDVYIRIFSLQLNGMKVFLSFSTHRVYNCRSSVPHM